MKKQLKFQSQISCKINGVLHTFKSNELAVDIIDTKRKTTVKDAPYFPSKQNCKTNCKTNCLVWLLLILKK